MFEKVNPMHPDKLADRIAGALVDKAYEKEENPRIAVEVLLGHGECHIIVESSVYITLDEVTDVSYSEPVYKGKKSKGTVTVKFKPECKYYSGTMTLTYKITKAPKK